MKKYMKLLAHVESGIQESVDNSRILIDSVFDKILIENAHNGIEPDVEILKHIQRVKFFLERIESFSSMPICNLPPEKGGKK